MVSNATFYTYLLALLALGPLLLIILQILSDWFGLKKISDRSTRILVYCIYVSSFCCTLIGFSLHFSTSRIWCKTIGLTPCFAVLGASKAFVYLFFLRRAKLAQGMIITIWTKIFFKYIGPIYLFIYFILYTTLTMVVFSAKYIDNTSNKNISHCVFAKWALWFPTFAGSVDLFNSLSLLSLFVYPLIRAMYEEQQINACVTKTNTKNNKNISHLGFVTALKWNVFFTLIASISSITTLFMIAVADQYIWAFCIGDPAINSCATFFMIAKNRRFLREIFQRSHKSIELSINRIHSASNVCSAKKDTNPHVQTKKTHPQSEVIVEDVKCDIQVDNQKETEHSVPQLNTNLSKSCNAIVHMPPPLFITNVSSKSSIEIIYND